MAIQQNFAAFTPSLNLNFARSKKLDPRVTFGRSSKATRMNEEGLIEVVGNNVPRFDHTYDASTGTIRSLGLLIEESRTNLISYSEDQSLWGGFRSSVTTNQISSPDGNVTADLITASETNVNGGARSIGFTPSISTYTFSVFAKKNTTSALLLRSQSVETFSQAAQAYFNLDTGQTANVSGDGAVFTNVSATMKDFGNGWYRCSVTFTLSSASFTGQSRIYVVNSTGSLSVTSGASFYVWGAQLEVGAFPTSYIPTAGLETPRALELATMTGTNFSSWYNQLEGTYLVSTKIAHSPNPDVSMFFRTLNTAAPGERVSIEQVPGNTLQFLVENTGGSYSFAPPGGGILGNDQFRKTGLTYISTNGTTTVAGASNLSVSADVTSTRDVAKNMNTLRLGRYTDTLYFLNGHIQQFVYYPRKLTNAQLQQLTR